MGLGTLSAASTVDCGTELNALAVGDINRDGYLDLVFASQAGTVSWMLQDQNPNATFGVPSRVAFIEGAPQNIALADVNSDGYVDAVVTVPSANSFMVLTGDSAGLTEPTTTVPCGANPQALVVADMNHDGLLDVVVQSHGDGTVQIFAGGTHGVTFAAQAPAAVGQAPQGLVAADFDRDGATDVATVSNGNAVAVALGNGAGTFQAIKTFGLGAVGSALTVVDLNRDNAPDLVMSTSAGLTLLQNDTKARCTWGLTGRTLTSAPQVPLTFASSDFNGDGKVDLLTTAMNAGMLLMLGDGAGNFGASQVVSTTGGELDNPIAADLNRDGNMDAAAVSSNSNTLAILVNDGNGAFSHTTLFVDAPHSVAADDMTSDAIPDLIVTLSSSNAVAVFANDGHAGFGVVNFFPTGDGPTALASGDFNSDGYNDVVVLNQLGSSITVLLGNGAGALTSASTYVTHAQPRGVVVGDFNNDGSLDVAVACYVGYVDVWLGTGTGAFGSRITSTVVNASFVTAIDIDRDGLLDLFLGSTISQNAGVAFGDGLGHFSNLSVEMAGVPAYASAVDVNGDLYPDIVSTNATESVFGVLLNDQQGSFESGIPSVSLATQNIVRIADYNRDGNLDAVISNNDSVASLYLGDGSGEFLLMQTLTAGNFGAGLADINRDGWLDLQIGANNGFFTSAYDPNALAFGAPQQVRIGADDADLVTVDIDRNGTVDILMPDCGGQRVVFVLGDGSGSFGPPNYVTIPGSSCPYKSAIGDIDNNGTIDVIVGDINEAKLYVLLGDGAGSFQNSTPVSTPSATILPILKDINRDGDLDLVYCQAGLLYVSTGLGHGSFNAPHAVAVAPSPLACNVADVNDDGKLDMLVVVSNYTVSLMLGDGTGNFSQPLYVGYDWDNRSNDVFQLADFNHDGLPDVLFSNSSAGSAGLTTFLGR